MDTRGTLTFLLLLVGERPVPRVSTNYSAPAFLFFSHPSVHYFGLPLFFFWCVCALGSRLSGELVQELRLPQPLAAPAALGESMGGGGGGGGGASPTTGYVGGLVRDAATGAVHVWSPAGLWRVEVAREARDAWRLTLARALASSSLGPSATAKFDDARRLAEGPQQRQTVLAKQVCVGHADVFEGGGVGKKR